MVIVYILLGLFLLLAVALYLPLRIALSYHLEEGLQYKLYYGWFCLTDSTKEKPVAEKLQEPTPPKKKKKRRILSSATNTLMNFLGLGDIASIANARKALNEKGLCQMLSEIAKAVRDLLRTTGRLVGKGRFRRFELQILVGDTDAGDAALHYGQTCALLYPMLDSLKAVRKCKNRRIDLRCDFQREESMVRFDGLLQYRPWHVIGFLGGLIWNHIRRRGNES